MFGVYYLAFLCLDGHNQRADDTELTVISRRATTPYFLSGWVDHYSAGQIDHLPPLTQTT